MKKVIITEAQYKKLESLLFETSFNSIVKDTITVGDTIRITRGDTVNNYKVIKKDANYFIMDSLDAKSANKNYTYFIDMNSLHGSNLELGRAHKINDKDKLGDVKTWDRRNLNIDNFEVIRDGKVIDIVDPIIPINKPKKQKNQKTPDTEEFGIKVSDILLNIKDVKKGQALLFELADGSEINFCVDGSGGYKYTMGIRGKSSYYELNDWDYFIFHINYNGDDQYENLYKKNDKLITSSDGGETINFKVRAISGEKNKKDIFIRGIKNISILNHCEGEEPEEDDEDLLDDAKAAYDEIINDPLLKQAFYKQPNLWSLFVAELKGKKAPGTGIVPTLDIVGSYINKKLDKELGGEFIIHEYVSYRLLGKPIDVKFLNKKSNPDNFNINTLDVYKAKVKPSNYNNPDAYRTLTSPEQEKYEILIKERVGDNIFLCDFIKFQTGGKNIVIENKKIQLLKSRGFKPNK